MPEKPGRMEVLTDNIPLDLKQGNFVLWKYEWDEKTNRFTKPPYQPNSFRASTTDETHWKDFGGILAAHGSGQWDGIGYVFSKKNKITGIDLDACVDSEGRVAPWAEEIVCYFSSYTEVSPSGTGLKIWIRGMLPKGGHRDSKVEIHDSAKYFTITGHIYKFSKVESRQNELDSFMKKRWPGDFREDEPRVARGGNGQGMQDNEVLEVAMRNPKFVKLWGGDYSQYLKPDGEPDHSRGDSALIAKLLFYCGNNSEQADRLFRQSGMNRPKWEKRADYRQVTIRKCLSLVQEPYSPREDPPPPEEPPPWEGIEGEPEIKSQISDPPITLADMKSIPNAPAAAKLTFPHEAIVGLGGDYANLYSSYMEVPPPFFLMAFLTCLGHVLADKITICSEISQEPRLYTILLGESADDRKSTGIIKTVDFFKDAVDGFSMCWGVGSAEGLQKRLETNNILLLCLDEFKQFTSKCKIESSVLLPCVNTLFESNRYENQIKTSHVNLENAHLSLLAASTVQTYENTWDKQFTDIGFNNRLFLVPGSGEAKFPVPAKIPESEKNLLKQRLGELLKHAQKYPELKLSPGANRLHTEWYMKRERSIHSKRLDTYSLRLMPLFAVNSLKSEVDEETVQRVHALCNWQLEIRRLYDPIDAENQYAKMEEKVRRVLTARGPLTSRQLRQFTNTKANGVWLFNAAIESLKKVGDITFLREGKQYAIQP